MESAQLLVKESPKKGPEEPPKETPMDLKEVQVPTNARAHIPSVYEHQYAEYISGLIPPYVAIGFPPKASKKNAGNKKTPDFKGD